MDNGNEDLDIGGFLVSFSSEDPDITTEQRSFEEDGENESVDGTSIPLNDKTVVLGFPPEACLEDLPQGNQVYESKYSTFCEDKAEKLKAEGLSFDAAMAVEAKASDCKEISTSLGVAPCVKGKSKSITSAPMTFYRLSKTGRISERNWKQNRYRKIRDRETLSTKIKSAFKSRWKKAVTIAFHQPEENADDCITERVRKVSLNLSDSSLTPVEVTKLADARQAFSKGRAEIRKCRIIDEFFDMFEVGGIIGEALERISRAVGTQDPEEWSKRWAERLVEDELTAECLDYDRKLAIQFLLKLCDRWKKDGTVTDSDMSEPLHGGMVYRILRLCLPMMRARTLYAASVAGRGPVGAHWVAQRHIEQDPKWERIMEEHIPTIDERFYSFVEFEPLKFSKNQAFLKWLQPREAQSLECPIGLSHDTTKERS